jgi:hypothetical protein
MRGARMAVKGVPINTLEWDLDYKKQEVLVTLYSYPLVTITEIYLTSLFESIDSAFRVLVLAKDDQSE